MLRATAAVFGVVLYSRLGAGYGFSPDSSAAAGDLDANAPFGIPADEFKDATLKPNASATYSIFGYNVSVPAGEDPNGNGNSIDGWTMSAAVAADIALTDADDLPAKKKSMVTEATTLSIYPPDGIKVADSWRMCAVVYPGLSIDAAEPTTQLNGTCGAFLPSDCIHQLQVVMTYSGMTKGGKCSSPGIPVKCQGHFPTGVNGTAFALSSSTVSNNRFYAFGAPPTSSGNKYALAEAVENVWPVLIAWGHLAENGNFTAITAYLQCLGASNGSSTPSAKPSVGTKQLGVGSRWAFALATAMGLWLVEMAL